MSDLHPPEFCHQAKAVESLEKDVEDIVQRLNLMIRENNERNLALTALSGKVDLVADRIPSDLKVTLANIQGTLKSLDEFRGQGYKLVGAVLIALALAFVAFVVSGGMKVTG